MTIQSSSPTLPSRGASGTAKFVVVELVSGLIVSAISIAYAVGFSALVFDGPIASGLSTGIWAILVGTAVSSIIVGVLTSIPPMAANVEATTISMLKMMTLSVIAASVAAGASSAQMLTNVFAGIIVATFVSGVCLYLVGAFRLGQYLRFVPSAVTGGFLAGTGIVVLIASLKVATGMDVTTVWAAVRSDPSLASRGLAAIAFFLAYQFLRRHVKSPLLMPVFFMGTSAVVYALSRMPGFGEVLSPWFPSGTSEMRPWNLLSPASIGAVDWSVLLAAMPEIIAMCVVVVVTLVVRTSSFEVAFNQRADFDMEFRGHGIASMISAALGGAACAAAAGTTRLLADLGAKSALSAFTVSGVVLLILLAGIDLTAYFALPLLGGLLLIVGWTLAAQAILPPIRQKSWGDVLVIATIVAVAMRFGFAASSAVGFAFSCFLFALSYARVSVVRRHMTRATFASHVARTAVLERYLREEGQRVHIYWLGGYIFFGSSDRLYDEVRASIEGQQGKPVSHIIIDGAEITGLDTAAAQSLKKLGSFCAGRGITIVYAGLSRHIEDALASAGLFSGACRTRTFPHTNLALAWCEDEMLPGAPEAGVEAFPAWLAEEAQMQGNDQQLMSYFEKRTLAAGEALYVTGSAADTIDIVVAGSVSIVVGDGSQRHEVRRISTRTVLGEMGFFRRQQRSASVIANEPVVAYTLTRDNYERMQREAPALAQGFVVYLVKILSDRLEFANAAITSLVPQSATKNVTTATRPASR